ncbi:glutathione S-transferase family protein [Rhodoferax sp. AJA081-3]|uniref:glutathione S-transferase family protein n=1 Tax=Rhodoferax sp. AJA081-3 TaxID=2752316 RepID=UPI001ADF12CE|nr:glutathione S-transferase family protein [Rhodoferax sp. AJA081-3]QTN28361.1 glutathione S-transferase family protein [Rhodoferax sp. AJA081-3]
MALTLYYHPLASFCHKVLVALYENNIAFEARMIDLGAEQDRATLSALWPFCKFPVLQDHTSQRSVPESSIIIEYLDRFGEQNPMVPRNAEDALQVRLWDRILDNHVHEPMQNIVLDRIHGSQGDMAGARATIQTAYGLINQQVASQPWAAGHNFSLADCAAAPALFYAHTLEAFPEHHVHLHAYFEKLIARPSVQRVLAEAKPYFPMYPFYSAIPARFL